MDALNSASVVIPCHTQRGWKELVGAVESVRRQSPVPVEIVVAVDHNPDLFALAASTFRDAIVVANAYAPGASGNRNTGVACTTTPIVAMLDGDACARPGWLAGLVAPFADPDVVGTGGAIVPVWRGVRPGWFPDEFLWTVGGSFPVATRQPVPTRNVWSASMAVRRDAFDAIGGFRVGFGKQGTRARPEDTEMCLRLAAASGGRWMYVPDAEVEHPVPVERTRFRAFLSRCYQEGRGKVEMARLLGGGTSLGSERVYLRRTLPNAVGRGLAAAVRGQGVSHAVVAGATVLGVAAAGIGGGLEAMRPNREYRAALPAAPLPMASLSAKPLPNTSLPNTPLPDTSLPTTSIPTTPLSTTPQPATPAAAATAATAATSVTPLPAVSRNGRHTDGRPVEEPQRPGAVRTPSNTGTVAAGVRP